MSLPVVFHRAARDDLDQAYRWYERQSVGLGEELLASVREILKQIQQNPARFALVHRNVRHGLTRRFPYGVYYRVEARRIVVVAVYHSSRDPLGWQARL
jgi:plasmid stabilization system protein ParE